MVYPALLPLMRTPRLPAVDWTDAPADLNGLVRFAERRNLVYMAVPSHFRRSLRQHQVPLYPLSVCSALTATLIFPPLFNPLRLVPPNNPATYKCNDYLTDWLHTHTHTHTKHTHTHNTHTHLTHTHTHKTHTQHTHKTHKHTHNTHTQNGET
jgi:hypothetical protein